MLRVRADANNTAGEGEGERRAKVQEPRRYGDRRGGSPKVGSLWGQARLCGVGRRPGERPRLGSYK